MTEPGRTLDEPGATNPGEQDRGSVCGPDADVVAVVDSPESVFESPPNGVGSGTLFERAIQEIRARRWAIQNAVVGAIAALHC